MEDSRYPVTLLRPSALDPEARRAPVMEYDQSLSPGLPGTTNYKTLDIFEIYNTGLTRPLGARKSPLKTCEVPKCKLIVPFNKAAICRCRRALHLNPRAENITHSYDYRWAAVSQMRRLQGIAVYSA